MDCFSFIVENYNIKWLRLNCIIYFWLLTLWHFVWKGQKKLKWKIYYYTIHQTTLCLSLYWIWFKKRDFSVVLLFDFFKQTKVLSYINWWQKSIFDIQTINSSNAHIFFKYLITFSYEKKNMVNIYPPEYTVF